MDNNYLLYDAYDVSDIGIPSLDENTNKENGQENKNESIEPIADASVTSDS